LGEAEAKAAEGEKVRFPPFFPFFWNGKAIVAAGKKKKGFITRARVFLLSVLFIIDGNHRERESVSR
jgi:hypothetical protein